MDRRLSLSSWFFVLAGLLTFRSAAETPAAVAPPAALKYEEPLSLSAEIYGRGKLGNELLFRFQRESKRSGEELDVRRDYNYPDGKPAAEERVLYHGNSLISYHLDDKQTGAIGDVRVRYEGNRNALELEYVKGGSHKKRTEVLKDNTLTSDMVGPFLSEHWDALAHGTKVSCRYIVVSRVETVGFTFVKESASIWHGQRVLVVRMEPTSKVISLLVDPLVFVMESIPPHRVLQYTGRTTPKIIAGTSWKELDAVTVFNWDTAR